MILDLKTRSYDGKVELVELMTDPTFEGVVNESNSAFISKRWITIGVFDDFQTAKKEKENCLGQRK